MEQPLGVIFDMDGVLIDSYDAHYRSWLAMAHAHGLTMTAEQFRRTFGRTSREIIAALWGAGRFGDAQIAELDEEKEAAFRRLIERDFPAMPGAVELVAALDDDGFRLAVGSSGPPANVEMALGRLGCRDRFSALVTGADVTRGKPDPQVFAIAADRLGVRPERCVVVEDAPAGVEAAHAAGMRAVGLVSSGRTPEQLAQADLVVRALGELSPQRIRSLLALSIA